MPKEKSSLQSKYKKWINVCEEKCFTTDGKVIFCKLCDKEIACSKKFQLDQHLTSAKHLKRKSENENKGNNQNQGKQTLLTNLVEKSSKDIFSQDLAEAMVSVNLPWKALENPTFKTFLEKYTKKTVPYESTLRKNYLPDMYATVIQNIKNDIGDSPVWIEVDETTDVEGRFIANFIVGALDPNSPRKPYLLTTKKLDAVNSDEIIRFVIDSTKILWPDTSSTDKTLLFLSDAATYMVKAGKTLKILFPQMEHVTCLAHAMHRVVEEIRSKYSDINLLISAVKKVFLKAPERIATYREMLPDVPLPPDVIVTRWGSWLKAVNFYAQHFDSIKKVVETLADDAASVVTAKAVIKKSGISESLAFISALYGFLVDIIEHMEKRDQLLTEQVDRVKVVESRLKSVPGVSYLKEAASILSGSDSSNLSSRKIALVPFSKFAPTTSCNVERSFSAYKLILTDKRRNSTVENLERTLVVYCNLNY